RTSLGHLSTSGETRRLLPEDYTRNKVFVSQHCSADSHPTVETRLFHNVSSSDLVEAHIIFGERGGGGARGADILQLGALELLLEPTVVFGEAVQHRGHPPGEVLGAPDPPQAARGVGFEQIAAVGSVELRER